MSAVGSATNAPRIKGVSVAVQQRDPFSDEIAQLKKMTGRALPENQLKVYTDAVTYYKTKGWQDVDELTSSFSELVKAKPDEKQWEIYTDAVAYYKTKGFGINELTSSFSELVKAKPDEKQREVYTDAVAYYKTKGWWIDELTNSFSELVKAKPDEKRWILYAGIVPYFIQADCRHINKLTLGFSELAKLNEKQWTLYKNAATPYYREKGWRHVDFFTEDFIKLAETKPDITRTDVEALLPQLEL
jgi:hypothetical protein